MIGEGVGLMPKSPEGLHKSGEDFLLQTKTYLEATLVIEVPWTVYDGVGQTSLKGLDNKPHSFDALGYLKEGKKRPIYIEAKKRSDNTINREYDDFVAEAFSCFIEGQWLPDWDPYFMFVANRPFKTSDYERLTSTEYLLDFLNTKGAGLYGIVKASLPQVESFKERLWLIIWSNYQGLMCVTNPAHYARVQLEGRNGA